MKYHSRWLWNENSWAASPSPGLERAHTQRHREVSSETPRQPSKIPPALKTNDINPQESEHRNTFKQTIKNLHSGKSAYSSLNCSPAAWNGRGAARTLQHGGSVTLIHEPAAWEQPPSWNYYWTSDLGKYEQGQEEEPHEGCVQVWLIIRWEARLTERPKAG